MKRLHLREIALLCSPIVFIAGAVLIPLWRRPPKDPNAVIALSVTSKPSQMGTNPLAPKVNFAWEAKAVGGPKYGYRIGYRQQIVAILKKGEKVIFSEPGMGAVNGSSSSMAGGGYTPGQLASTSQDLQLDGQIVPLNTTRLEWRGDFVGVPKEDGSVANPASAAQLQKWAAIKGAARVTKTILIAFDPSKNAISGFGVEPVNPTNASRGADSCVVVKLRDEPRRVYRRVVAFDGRIHRIVWDDNSDGFNPYWQSNQSEYFGGLRRDIYLFRLRKVPREWGEITFLQDVVFTEGTAKSQPKETTADLKTIDALAKAGNLRFSRRVVLRRAGTTIAAPKFQKTPNLQFRNLTVQSDNTGTRVLVTMNYTGGSPSPNIEVPDFADVYDPLKRTYDTYAKSYGIDRGSKPGEWILKVDLQNLTKAPRKLRLEIDVADNHAAPLHIKSDFTLPNQTP